MKPTNAKKEQNDEKSKKLTKLSDIISVPELSGIMNTNIKINPEAFTVFFAENKTKKDAIIGLIEDIRTLNSILSG